MSAGSSGHHAARKRFGQHFLTDAALIDEIVRDIAPKPGEALVEIGPGLGALTQPLLERCGALTVIELDRDLAKRWRARQGVTVIESDVLRVDFSALSQTFGKPLRIVGNLPYNISTPILFHLLPVAHLVADQHAMLQKEVVERMAAPPGGKDYGRLSVMLQWRYAITALLDVPPAAFDPPPRVDSAVVRMRPLAEPPRLDGALLEKLVTVAFSQRRKLLRHSLGRWLDEDYIARHVDGFSALQAEALRWPPERAAAVCGLPVEQITRLAQDYATTRPAAIRLNYGMQRVAGGGNAVRLVALLPCLTGAWRERGGGLLLSASGWFKAFRNDDWLQRPDLLAGRRPRTLNMSTIGDDLLRESSPGFGPRVEAVVVYNSNPVAVAPDSPKVVAGFRREDLFTVVLEHFLTDTADHADYVLPATTQLEHRDVHTTYGHTWIVANHPAVAPLGQAKPNTQIFRELAARMGFDDPCFADSDEELAARAVQGVDAGALARDGWVRLPLPERPFADGGFAMPDGKAQVVVPGWGAPAYVPPHESRQSSPALAARYPLAMISPPARHFLNSSFVNVKSLRAIEGEPLLEIHPDDAAARGIADGAMLRVFNDRGSYHCRAAVGTRARPGVVNGLGVWWRKLGARGTNVNELTSQRLTDIGRGPTFYDCLVEVEPAPATVADGAGAAAA